MNPSPLSRRAFFRTTGTAAITAAAASLHHRLEAADAATGRKGRINHSVCKWCYPKIDLETSARPARRWG